jgi:hypothetical protein
VRVRRSGRARIRVTPPTYPLQFARLCRATGGFTPLHLLCYFAALQLLFLYSFHCTNPTHIIADLFYFDQRLRTEIRNMLEF